MTVPDEPADALAVSAGLKLEELRVMAVQRHQPLAGLHILTRLDRAEGGIKPALVQALGAEYHTEPVPEPDIVLECTGVAELVADVMQHTAPGAIVCLTGVSQTRTLSVDMGALNNELVLENDVTFLTIVGTLLSDILLAVMDPRIRMEK